MHPDIEAVIDEGLAEKAKGLDLDDPDDRAVFRTRVADMVAHMRTSALIEHARRWGAEVPGNASHGMAVRRLADAWLATQRQGGQ